MPARLGNYNHEVFQNLPLAEDAFLYVDENPMGSDVVEELR